MRGQATKQGKGKNPAKSNEDNTGRLDNVKTSLYVLFR